MLMEAAYLHNPLQALNGFWFHVGGVLNVEVLQLRRRVGYEGSCPGGPILIVAAGDQQGLQLADNSVRKRKHV
jgi:hypothetical protein